MFEVLLVVESFGVILVVDWIVLDIILDSVLGWVRKVLFEMWLCIVVLGVWCLVSLVMCVIRVLLLCLLLKWMLIWVVVFVGMILCVGLLMVMLVSLILEGWN